jgi:hypothetical protein
VRTEPTAIDGLTGPVVITTHSWGRPTLTVGGQPAPRVGRRRYALPAATGGAVEAHLRIGFADPYPTLEVNGEQVRTGPKPPAVLRVLALLPILLVGVGGALGGMFGMFGLLANLAVARTRIPTIAKALTMIGVGVLACLVWLIIAVVLRAVLAPG